MLNKRGQLSIINIMWFVILVAVGAVVTPLLAEFAAIGADAANSSMGSLGASAIVPFFWLGVIITFFIYVIPQGVQQQ
jgi:hypothetical protein